MMAHIRALLLLFVTSMILQGCATVDSTTNVEWESHQQRLAMINAYQASGKLGYIAPQQRQSLNFQWHDASNETQLRMTTFLGQTVLNLNATPTLATVETYDGNTYSAPTPEALIKQLTRLNIPVEQLNDWMLGRPTQSDSYQLNQTNTLASLTKRVSKQNWQLDYLSYQDVQHLGAPLPLPKKIKLTQGDTSINIVISKWTFNE
ncbi:lipoprotein insertase outer membrane protein LolB [Vibrio sp. TBV020]|uniref:lipoprotein insertase outer membrane protein LolB n=1 Tax=Vibrio sp. TBV020 TaxID=3137398 RepID=UPI0038CD658E